MSNDIKFTERQKKAQAVLAVIFIGCIVAVALALTIKFITWLF